MRFRLLQNAVSGILCLLLLSGSVVGQKRGLDLIGRVANPFAEEEDQPKPVRNWQYGGFIDAAYPLHFNHPANRLFRSRGTAFRTDSVWLNMAGFYVRKRPSEDTRWGGELTAHGRT